MRAFIYTMSIEEALQELVTDAAAGLHGEEAAGRLAQRGQNVLKSPKKRPALAIMADQFKDILVLSLIVSAIVSVIVGGRLADTIIIIALLLVSMIITAIVRDKSEIAIRDVRDAPRQRARVRRESQIINIDAREVVVGDIVVFGRGDMIPADIRLTESSRLEIDESPITGEAESASKDANAVLEGDAALGERRNLAFMGSTVTHGRGAGVVYATGMNTEKGKKTVIAAKPEAMRTIVQDNLNDAAKSLGVLCVIMCAVIFAVGVLYDFFDIGAERGMMEMLIISLALVIAASPKGIAANVTVIMAAGAQKMLKSDIAIKKLRDGLGIGGATVICTNKTGSLTQNKMTITHVADCENTYEVTGVGYKARGHVVADIMITRNIALMSEIVVLCNDAEYDRRRFQITGDATEGAMLVFGAKLGHDKQTLNAMRPRIHEIPFDSERKIMSTFNMDGERVIMYTKGAAEEIIKRSTYVYLDGEIAFMSETIRERLMAKCDGFADQAFRVLACAYKVFESKADIKSDEHDLIYVGMMCLADPLRDGLREAVQRCKGAGIDVKIITGDHGGTAGAIARELGICSRGDEILSGSNISALPDEELQEKVKNVKVFARVMPEDKLRIVAAIKSNEGNTVAVTGKSLDDVHAMKEADVGVAMGLSIRDVARETADVLIGDESFFGIVTAVEQSRAIYANIRKTVGYVLTAGVGMLLLVFAVLVFSLPLPLVAVQLLLIKLLICAYTAPSLGAERAETVTMTRRQRNPEASVLNRRVVGSIALRALFVFISSLAAYFYGLYVAVAQDGVEQYVLAMSMCFFTFVAVMLIAAFSLKTDAYMRASKTVLKNKFLNISALVSLLTLVAVFYIPGAGNLFSLAPLTIDQVFICLLLVFLTTVSFELSKRGAVQ